MWMQMIADCIGYPVIIDKDGIKGGTSRGVALTAASTVLLNEIQSNHYVNSMRGNEKLIVEKSSTP